MAASNGPERSRTTEGMTRNLRWAMKGLRRTPGFTAMSILTLALGIGLSTAVFTVAQAMLLRRLPVLDQDRLVVLWGETRDGNFDNYPVTVADVREFARRSVALQQVAFVAYEGATQKPVREGDQISRYRQSLVSGDFFDVLGVRPLLGRALRPDDDIVGAGPILVLSHGVWQRRFGGSPEIVGRQLLMHETGVTYTIVGVMPEGLDYPAGTDYWAPLIPAKSRPGTDADGAAVDMIGRLADGASVADARNELTAFLGRPESPDWQRNLHGVVHTLPRLVLGETRPALLVFIAAAALLLLITCVNVADFLIVRGLGRMRELAVRSALGASRAQVFAQLLSENLLLAMAGGAAGLLVATGAVRAFIALAPAGLPRLTEIRPDSFTLAGAIGITTVALLAFGIAPALMASHSPLQQTLRSDARQSAGLLAKSLNRLERAELAIEPSRLLIGELALKYDLYDDKESQRTLMQTISERLAGIPGIRAVSPVVAVPFSGSGGWDGRPTADGQSPEEAAANPMLNMDVVDPGYFEALGMRIVRGRGFTDADREGSGQVVIVSQSTARYFWPNDDPIGKRMSMGASEDESFTVIGVVPDTRYRELREARPSIYFPLRQSFFPYVPMNLAIRTNRPPAELVPAIRRTIAAAAPGVALASAVPFGTFLERPLAQPRLNALLLVVFATAAAALAAVGLFGVVTTMVRQRTRELGIRLALGATSRELRRMVMRRGLGIAATGMAAGLIGTLVANRLLRGLLYETSPADVPTLAAVCGLLLGIAMVSALIPAHSTTRIEAVSALRVDP
jgi:putative ABC transport system permease protein